MGYKATYHSGENGADRSRNGYGHLFQEMNNNKENENGVFQVERDVKRRQFTKVKRMHGQSIGRLRIYLSIGRSMQFETKGAAEKAWKQNNKLN